MKAFIAITLLAACAAAQTFDHQTGLRQQLLKREHGLVNGLWKDVFGIGKDYSYDTLRNVNTYPYTIPTTYNTVNGVNTLSLDEIIHHPLFQTYYTLPLFRQHFSHPLFQLYLTTPYFQQYWTQQIFTTFFRNPYLFNKYIYPVVYNTAATGVFNNEYDFGLTTKNIVGDYTTQSVFPKINHVQYATVMDKVFKTLFVNHPEILEVKTDVKIQTPVEEQTLGKYVDPITGEIKYTVGDVKTVENTIAPVEVINTIRKPVFDNELIKNELIKKFFLNKVLYGDRKVDQIIPKIFNLNKYESIYPRDLISKYETVLPRDFINKYETILPRDFVNKYVSILPRHFVNKYENILPRNLVNKFETVLPQELINKYETVLPRELLNKYETVLPRELINKYETVLPRELFNKYETIVPRDLVNKYETILPRDLVNKYETILPRDLVNKYETILPRDLVNKYETILPRELVNKYETVLPRELVNRYETILPRDLVNKYETVIPRDIDLINKIETVNKLENILKPVIAA